MNNLNINIGVKEYSINGDESRVIRINTTDMNLLPRIKKAHKELLRLADKYENISNTVTDDEVADIIVSADKEVRDKIDYMFGGEVSNIIFGVTNCLSIAGGQPVFKNFLDVVLPVIQADIEKEQKQLSPNIVKYTSQVKK